MFGLGEVAARRNFSPTADIDARVAKLEKHSDDRDTGLESRLASVEIAIKRHGELLDVFAARHENDGAIEQRLAQMQETVASLMSALAEAKIFLRLGIYIFGGAVFLAGILSPKLLANIAVFIGKVFGLNN